LLFGLEDGVLILWIRVDAGVGTSLDMFLRVCPNGRCDSKVHISLMGTFEFVYVACSPVKILLFFGTRIVMRPQWAPSLVDIGQSLGGSVMKEVEGCQDSSTEEEAQEPPSATNHSYDG
jgi:hypothetical protein